jgi:hypothetical protein
MWKPDVKSGRRYTHRWAGRYLAKEVGVGVSGIFEMIKTRCNDIQRQISVAKMKKKKYLVSYWERKGE